mmetsp:Transcript_28171/g.65105  ORF Transcript_28171/g.65105 Transcript_28171/m.65105 type:complete len:294 (+) Transcript_28171:496-1377(+)
MDRNDCPSDISFTFSITSFSARGKPEAASICVIKDQRLLMPPGNFCSPLASTPNSSADQLADFAAFSASLASMAFCSPFRFASSRCLDCSSSSAAFCLRHFSSSPLKLLVTFVGSSASNRKHNSSSCSTSNANAKSCSSCVSTAFKLLDWPCASFFNLCRNPLATCFCCCRCSFSSRSFSSRSCLSFSSRCNFSSSSLRFCSSSACFCLARFSFSSLFLASFSSFSARIRGSSRSAVSTNFTSLFRSASWYFFRPFWFCLSIQRRSSRNSASSRLYSSCMEKSLQESKSNQKS